MLYCALATAFFYLDGCGAFYFGEDGRWEMEVAGMLSSLLVCFDICIGLWLSLSPSPYPIGDVPWRGRGIV